jgi:hypothetical protein
LPQAPQLRVSVWVLTHIAGIPQAVEPMGHRHTPITQPWPAGHALPHEPQLALSVCVSTQVCAAPMPQIVRGAVQSTRHAPAMQLCPIGQALPQAPQLALSVCVFTQAPPQVICPIGQVQTPAIQVCPAEHALPQPPQLALSVCVSMHIPEHAVCPIGQDTSGMLILSGMSASGMLDPSGMSASGMLITSGRTPVSATTSGRGPVSIWDASVPASVPGYGPPHAATAALNSNSVCKRFIKDPPPRRRRSDPARTHARALEASLRTLSDRKKFSIVHGLRSTRRSYAERALFQAKSASMRSSALVLVTAGSA